MSAVVRHVCESIAPASEVFAEEARARVSAAAAGLLERLAARLAGAQHTASPRAERRLIVVVAGDHGAADPGIVLGPAHPTVIAATAIADGSAALCGVARASRAPIVVVDAGAVERASMPASAIQLGRGPTRDLLREPAMTVVDATLGLEAGIALAMSLSEHGLDVLAVGALGLGSDLAAAALLGATDSRIIEQVVEHATVDTRDLDAWRQASRRGRTLIGASPLELLSEVGGPETCVLAGLILGAASVNTPILLDGHATATAAMIARRLAPDVQGYLIATHNGTALHPALLTQLALEPVFAVGLGHGEGIGAAMVLPLVDQVETLARPR